MAPPKQVNAPIRLTPEMQAKISDAARLTGLSQADVMRLCLAIGLEDLRKVGWDIARAISDAAESSGIKLRPVLNVAEDEAPFGDNGKTG